MLIDDVRTRETLRRIVGRLTRDAALQQDLMQEALLLLWLLEEQRPGQTQSWYFQGCHFRLKNYLAAGRSIDSPKRRSKAVRFDGDWDIPYHFGSGNQEDGDSVVDEVSTRDILTLLSEKLTDQEQIILRYLSEGLGAREIAAKVHVSHPVIIKHRRKIATLAIRLGIVPLPRNGVPKNGKRVSPLVRQPRSRVKSLEPSRPVLAESHTV